MSKELVISATRHETRVAVIEDDQPVEVYHQRENEYSLAGSIHKGRVTRVLPGMQSAFVDIGLDRDAFLYVSDFFEDNEEYDKIVTSVEEKVLKQMDRALQPPPPASLMAVPPVEPEVALPVNGNATAAAESSPVASPPMAAPVQEQRRDDRDRRGRRSRRRRGQKGGRGLPDSKFYSPGGHRGGPTESAPDSEFRTEPTAEPTAPEPRAPEIDDFFVLPGESLAKYTGPPRHDESHEESGEGDEPAQSMAESIIEESEPAAEEAEAEVEEAETAEDLEAAPADAAEPVEAVETVESPDLPEPESAELPENLEAEPEGGAVAEIEAVETIVEEEGPEPARIPTSLTATLREQGPRYLHRVSRRMRRRGRDQRDVRDPRHGAPQGGELPRQPQETHDEQRAVSTPKPATDARSERPAGGASIADLLKEGQEIIVQIAKEPLGQKGARITSHIALPGRFLVYMPTVDHIGVSRKIPSDDERARLKRILQTHRTGIPGGYIVRTAGEGRTEEELRADMLFLYNLWLDMRQKAERKPAPLLIHHDLNVVERVLRDQLTSAFKSIWVDNEEAYESVLRFVERFQPTLVSRVKLYTRSNPIFDEFGITAELEKALRPKVWLKSGGYIVINQTEALVAIDVNTGKFVGKSNRLEDTIVKTNTDAIKEIVRQIRLRDLGGIIVVDFIDMDERKNRQKVMQALEESMRADRAPYKILQFNDFGLVAITRKRVKQSLERTLCTPCPYCEGAGYVKSPQTVIGEILQEAQKLAKAIEGKDVMLRVSPDVARLLKSNQNSYLQELEEILGRSVIVKSDNQLHQEKFDLA